MENYYYKSSKENTTSKAKNLNRNETQEKLVENFASKPLVKNHEVGPEKIYLQF